MKPSANRSLVKDFVDNQLSCWLPNKKLSCAISLILIAYLLINFIYLIQKFVEPNFNSYGITEFLINFQGGFVRRGLLGEILYNIVGYTSMPVMVPIILISVLSAVCVLWFFFSKFKEKTYCWWIILSPCFCLYLHYIIRKDFLCYLILIASLVILAKKGNAIFNGLVATLLTVFALFLHEAYLLWGGALISLFLITDKRIPKIISIAGILLIISVFALQSYFKGSVQCAHAIVDSWNNLGGDNILKIHFDNSIGALGWETIHTKKDI